MLFILYAIKGEAAEQSPAGMGEIIRMGEYQSVRRALYHMKPSSSRSEHLIKQGRTTLALYENPKSLAIPERLVWTGKL